MRFLISLLLCAACSQPFSQGSTSPQLPSLLGDADLGSCDELDGAAHPGATSYYLGEFEGGDGTWLGTETWLLYANETWESDGQGDCEVVWDVSANETIECMMEDWAFSQVSRKRTT